MSLTVIPRPAGPQPDAGNVFYRIPVQVLLRVKLKGVFADNPAFPLSFLLNSLLTGLYWTCSITYFTEPYRVRVIEQVSQNAPHFAVFKRKLFKN
jgi:hypothetical protein